MRAGGKVAAGLALLSALGGAGCSREHSPSRLVVPAGTVDAPAADPALRWVTVATPLRRSPSEQAHVEAPGGKGPVANVLRALQRGDQVRLVSARDGWSQVRDADGVEGWVKDGTLLPPDGPGAATVLVEAWAFEQPDLLATNARRRIAPGTILFVRKTRELFTEVDAGPGPSTWVLSDRITTRPEDLEAARLAGKARLLARAGKQEEARATLAALRAVQPSSPLVAVLAVELGEVPAEGPTGPAGFPGATGPAGPSGAAPSAPSSDPPRPP